MSKADLLACRWTPQTLGVGIAALGCPAERRSTAACDQNNSGLARDATIGLVRSRRDGMVGIVAFHALMLLLGLGIVSRVVPSKRVSNMLGYLHKAIGITTPF